MLIELLAWPLLMQRPVWKLCFEATDRAKEEEKKLELNYLHAHDGLLLWCFRHDEDVLCELIDWSKEVRGDGGIKRTKMQKRQMGKDVRIGWKNQRRRWRGRRSRFLSEWALEMRKLQFFIYLGTLAVFPFLPDPGLGSRDGAPILFKRTKRGRLS